MTNCEVKPLVHQTEQESPVRVLFVCTGNTCRSPMAAAVFNDMAARTGRAGELCAESAGLFAHDGDPITPAASAALQRAGIPATPQNDYTAHSARTVTREHVAQADLVVAMTGAHAMQLLLRFPEAAAKITCPGADITDPFGGDDAVYERCLCDLRAVVCEMFFDGGMQ